MVSDIQQKANEENAKLGGVKTEEGIQASKYNAQKHAILRETIIEYEEEMREYVFNALVKELNPQGAIEEILALKFYVGTRDLKYLNELEQEVRKLHNLLAKNGGKP